MKAKRGYGRPNKKEQRVQRKRRAMAREAAYKFLDMLFGSVDDIRAALAENTGGPSEP